MGNTHNKLDTAGAQRIASLMGVQEKYVNVALEKVDFLNPTGAPQDEEDEEEGEAQNDEEFAYAGYAPKKLKIEGMRPHPSPAVENGTLATVEPPPATYRLAMSKHRPEVIREGRLSSLQLEFVVYACQQHESLLESGSRRGFFLGDGAGMGKGRQLAGLILENSLKGRRKHVWVSTSIDLIEDARRDLSDVGGTDWAEVVAMPSDVRRSIDEVCDGNENIRKNTVVVLFTTYSMMSKGCLNREDPQFVGPRLDQILDWLGDDFDGCLLFDEAHRAKNLVPELAGQETAAGRAVFLVQRHLPLARIVYCSATAVSEPRNYAYMTRLGLWGPGSPFPVADDSADESSDCCIKNFINLVSSRGVGAMELCALHLKMHGALCCRTLSYAGAEFGIHEASLTDEQQEQYDCAARLWQLLYTRVEMKLARIIVDCDGDLQDSPFGRERRNCHSHLWGGHQRFFKSLITSFKVPELVRLARQALDDGKCVIIGLQSTGEAHAKRAMDRQDDEDGAHVAASGADPSDMMSAPQETLLYVVSKIFEEEWSVLEEEENRANGIGVEVTPNEQLFSDEEEDQQEEKLANSALKKPLGESNSLAVSKPSAMKASSAGDILARAEEQRSRPDSFATVVSDLEDTDLVVGDRLSSSGSRRRKSSISAQEEDESSVEELDLCSDAPSSKRAKRDEDEDDWLGWESEPGSEDDPQKRHLMLDDASKDDHAIDSEDVDWLRWFKRQVSQLKLPGNALDLIIDELGGRDEVAEMSGRYSRMMRNYKGEWIYEKRSVNGCSQSEQNIYEREEFQAGRKLVAIISDAASSGISLHSENTDRVRNKRRRVHITLELPWSADKTIQQMGRSHRSNQLVAPEYKLLVSPLGGERRFVAAVVKRLESLGALTQGDRRATGVTKSLSCFNVDTNEGTDTILDILHHSYCRSSQLLGTRDIDDNLPLVKSPLLPHAERQAIAKLCIENAELVGADLERFAGRDCDVDSLADKITLLHGAKLWLSLVGINVDEWEGAVDSQGTIVSKFLNRILGLEISRQQWLFDYFARYLEKTIKASIRDGTYGQGITDLRGRKLKFLTSEHQELKLETPSPFPVELHVIDIDLGMDMDAADAKLKESRAGSSSTLSSAAPSAAAAGGTLASLDSQRGTRTMFGERDGFYLNTSRNPPIVVLLIEVGESSIRGLSVQTNTYQSYYPDKYPKREDMTANRFRWMKKLDHEQARQMWTRAFDLRMRGTTNYILTGPLLYIWGHVLYAQCMENAFAKTKIRVVRAVERDEKDNFSGHVELGIFLDWQKARNICKLLEGAVKDSENSRFAALQREHDIIREEQAERRQRSAKAGAATKKNQG